jgi:hypothetical protein
MTDDKRCGTCHHFGMIGGTLRMCTWGDQKPIPVCMMKDLVHPDDGKDCPCWKKQTGVYKRIASGLEHKGES